MVNRVAIEELEAWYFGDWEAVQAAYPGVNANLPQKAGFRDSDAVQGGTWEAFERVLQKARYFKNGLRKIEAARTVAEHGSQSQSFEELPRLPGGVERDGSDLMRGPWQEMAPLICQAGSAAEASVGSLHFVKNETRITKNEAVLD